MSQSNKVPRGRMLRVEVLEERCVLNGAPAMAHHAALHGAGTSLSAAILHHAPGKAVHGPSAAVHSTGHPSVSPDASPPKHSVAALPGHESLTKQHAHSETHYPSAVTSATPRASAGKHTGSEGMVKHTGPEGGVQHTQAAPSAHQLGEQGHLATHPAHPTAKHTAGQKKTTQEAHSQSKSPAPDSRPPSHQTGHPSKELAASTDSSNGRTLEATKSDLSPPPGDEGVKGSHTPPIPSADQPPAPPAHELAKESSPSTAPKHTGKETSKKQVSHKEKPAESAKEFTPPPSSSSSKATSPPPTAGKGTKTSTATSSKPAHMPTDRPASSKGSTKSTGSTTTTKSAGGSQKEPAAAGKSSTQGQGRPTPSANKQSSTSAAATPKALSKAPPARAVASDPEKPAASAATPASPDASDTAPSTDSADSGTAISTSADQTAPAHTAASAGEGLVLGSASPRTAVATGGMLGTQAPETAGRPGIGKASQQQRLTSLPNSASPGENVRAVALPSASRQATLAVDAQNENTSEEAPLEGEGGIALLPGPGAGLLAAYLPFDSATLEAAVERLLNQIADLGQAARHISSAGVSPWIVTGLIGATAAEIARRRLGQAPPLMAMPDSPLTQTDLARFLRQPG